MHEAQAYVTPQITKAPAPDVLLLPTFCCCRVLHEQLSAAVHEAAAAAVGSESLLLVLGALQVGDVHPYVFQLSRALKLVAAMSETTPA